MTARDRLVFTAGVLVLALIAGSLVSTGAPPAASPSPRSPAPVQVLREGVVGSVRTLDPHYVGRQAERDVAALIFSGLTRLGPGSTLVGDLAERWETSPDNLSHTFRLRADARWHDGLPVTADDVVFTIHSLQHPDYTGPLRSAWQDVGVERLDELSVRFTLPRASAGFLASTLVPIVPSHRLAGTTPGERAAGPFGVDPVGSGPFRLESKTDERVRLVAVASAAAPGDTPAPTASVAGKPEPTPDPVGRPVPLLRGIDVHLYRDAASLADAFERGEVDSASGLSPAAAARLGAVDGASVVAYPRTVLTCVVLNLRFDRAAFRDVDVRRALLTAIDRPGMLASALSRAGRVAETPISPDSPLFDASASGSVTHDLARAGALLEEAGWRRSKRGWVRPRGTAAFAFELSTVDAGTNPTAFAAAQRVVADWKRLGLAVQLKTYTAAELTEQKLVPGTYESAVITINVGHDPDLYPLLASSQAVTGGTNLSGYQSQKLDALLEQARLPADEATRRARFVALQQALATDLPVLPLFFGEYRYVVRDGLQGAVPRPISTPEERYWDVLTWRLADGPNG